MKQTKKNKISIFMWIMLIGFCTYIFIESQMNVWEKLFSIIGSLTTALLNIKRSIRVNKDFSLINGILVIEQTFSKKREYDLKNLSNWTQTQYHILGIQTRNYILIETENEKEIILWKNEPKDFEKLSNYLNENYSLRYLS